MGPGISLPQRTASGWARLLSPMSKKGSVEHEDTSSESPPPSFATQTKRLIRFSQNIVIPGRSWDSQVQGRSRGYIILAPAHNRAVYLPITLYVEVSLDSPHRRFKNGATFLPGAKTHIQRTRELGTAEDQYWHLRETLLNHSHCLRSRAWKRRKVGTSVSSCTNAVRSFGNKCATFTWPSAPESILVVAVFFVGF